MANAIALTLPPFFGRLRAGRFFLGQVLALQPVRVPAGATLPLAVRIAEVDGHLGAFDQHLMQDGLRAPLMRSALSVLGDLAFVHLGIVHVNAQRLGELAALLAQ